MVAATNCSTSATNTSSTVNSNNPSSRQHSLIDNDQGRCPRCCLQRLPRPAHVVGRVDGMTQHRWAACVSQLLNVRTTSSSPSLSSSEVVCQENTWWLSMLGLHCRHFASPRLPPSPLPLHSPQHNTHAPAHLCQCCLGKLDVWVDVIHHHTIQRHLRESSESDLQAICAWGFGTPEKDEYKSEQAVTPVKQNTEPASTLDQRLELPARQAQHLTAGGLDGDTQRHARHARHAPRRLVSV